MFIESSIEKTEIKSRIFKNNLVKGRVGQVMYWVTSWWTGVCKGCYDLIWQRFLNLQ